MTDLSVQLANVINENMTKFLEKVSTEFEIDETKLLEMWSSYSGVKTKEKKNIKKIKKEKIVKKIEKKDKGPTIKELKEKLKSLGLKVSGNKAELIKRLEEHSTSEQIYRYETGKYQKEYDTLWKKYVPQSGCCSDDHAEQFRLCSRIYYRVHNDGDFQGGYPSDLNDLIQKRYLYDEDYPLDVISGIEDIMFELEDEEEYDCDSNCESDCEPQRMTMSEKYKLVEEMMDASIKYAYDKLESN